MHARRRNFGDFSIYSTTEAGAVITPPVANADADEIGIVETPAKVDEALADEAPNRARAVNPMTPSTS